MKKYGLFSGKISNYPSGGMNDFTGDYDTVEEALLSATGLSDDGFARWWHVYDTATKERVAQSENTPHGEY